MDFNQLVDTLTNKFDVGGPIDISPFFDKGNSWLYDLLKSYHRVVYNDDYRLVFYFDKDEHLYQNDPGTLVTAFQQFVTEIDISHFFIILISTDDIAEDLETVRKLHSVDAVKIIHYQVNKVDCEFYVHNKEISTMCILPWLHLYVGSNAEIYPCCKSDRVKSMGFMKKDNTVADIMNHQHFNKMRKRMLNNKRTKECSICYNEEKQGIKSERIICNDRWAPLIPSVISKTNKDGSLIDFTLVSLNFAGTNICTLKCRMCSGETSSLIANEEKELFGIMRNTVSLTNRYNRLTPLIESLQDIEYISLIGGEPSVIVESYKILDKIIKLDKCDIQICYFTNLSSLTYKNKNLLDYWKKFSNITIHVSLEADNSRAEYIRHKTKWIELEQNYTKLIKECPTAIVKVQSTVNIYNAFNLITFHKDWIEEKLTAVNKIKINIVSTPEYLSIQVLPTFYKEKLNSMIDEHIQFLKCYDDHEDIVFTWQNIQQYMMSDDKSYLLANFFTYTDRLDKHRNENFENVFPEYSELRSYV